MRTRKVVTRGPCPTRSLARKKLGHRKKEAASRGTQKQGHFGGPGDKCSLKQGKGLFFPLGTQIPEGSLGAESALGTEAGISTTQRD